MYTQKEVYLLEILRFSKGQIRGSNSPFRRKSTPHVSTMSAEHDLNTFTPLISALERHRQVGLCV